MRIEFFALAALLSASPVLAQSGEDPFPEPIGARQPVIVVGVEDFATLPSVEGQAPRPMRLVDEPGTGRFFVNDMQGPLYVVPYDGGAATLWLDIDDARWGMAVESSGRERGFQSFAIHPDFNTPGAAGYGKLYTWGDVVDTAPAPDFTPGGGQDSHDTVLLEWTASDPAGPTYAGSAPRQLLRLEQPFGNHNAGHLAFNPLVSAGDPEFGMLYVGVADGGSGGDPLDLGQDLGSVFGKILRIDPLAGDSENGQYGIPSDNPWASDGDDGTLGEIFASGVRNPQRFGWDPANGNFFVADIGQNMVEELSLAWAGADLGWNSWEASFGFISRQELDLSNPRGEAGLSWPVAEYGHGDPLLQRQTAITGVVVYRDARIPALRGSVLFGDMPSGEIFHVPADDLPDGGQDGIGRVLLREGGEELTFLEIVGRETAERGLERASRTDLRIDSGPDGRLFLLNKHDGVIREIVP